MTPRARLSDWLEHVFRRPSSTTTPETPDDPTVRAGWFTELLTSTAFLTRFPQYADVITRMDPVATSSVSIAGVALRRLDAPDSRLLLLWNREYFEKHPEHRVGVLLHEIQHVVYGHLDDPTFHRVAYPRLMEVAMEISANEYLGGLGTELPPHGFDLQAFSRVGVTPGQSTRERYVVLRAAYEDGRLRPRDVWSLRGFDEHRARDHGSTASGIGDVLDARSDLTDERNWAGNSFALGGPSSRATLDRMRSAIQDYLSGAGGGPEDPQQNGRPRKAKELARAVHGGGTATALDWHRTLQEAFPSRRLVLPDYLRPNRRFVMRVGEIPGRRRRPYRPRLVAAIDTSGSMDLDALARITRELMRLGSLARVTVIECDAAVHRSYPLGTRPTTLLGGGDTDFAPAFDALPRSDQFDGLVYFTDGRGSMPDVPPHVPTLWVITHDQAFDAAFGSFVRLPR